MLLQKIRPFAKKAAAVGGVTAVGIVVFPHVEDSYWSHKYPGRVTGRHGQETHIMDKKQHKEKKKLVILGSGWASISALQNVDRDLYDITIISPRNYFLFTPLLPSVCSGTVTDDAVTVEIRDFTTYKSLPLIDRLGFMWRGYLPDRVNYLYAAAADVDISNKVVKCQYQSTSQETKLESANDESIVRSSENHFDVPYDMLVVGTGAMTNSFRTEGVDQYCHYLKETGDATLIRQAVLERLEQASLPNISDEERRRLLSFWVVGGGPTAVEFAAELQDFLHHDVVNPQHATYSRCAGYTSVSLVQSNKDLLPGYPDPIRHFALKRLQDCGIDVITEARASKVTSDKISVYDKKSEKTEEYPYGLCVWATGVAPGPLIQNLIASIPEQESYRTLKTDPYCRVIGTDNVFALGDCADIDVLAVYRKEITDLYSEIRNQHSTDDNRLSLEANQTFLLALRSKLKASNAIDAPRAKIVQDVQDLLETAKEEAKENGTAFRGLAKDDLDKIVQEQMKRQKVLPPTAQVAHQQGAYIGKLLSNPKIDEKSGVWSFDHSKGFEFRNLGQLVYVGGHMAAMTLPGSKDMDISWNGSLTNYVWHAAYFGMLESMKARSELLFDWGKTSIFGRSTALDAICSTDSSHVDSLRRGSGDKQEGKKPWWKVL